MSAFVDCVVQQLNKKGISKNEAKKFQKKFEFLKEKLSKKYSDDVLGEKAAAKLIENEMHTIIRHRRERVQQIVKNKEVLDSIDQSLTGRNVEDRSADFAQKVFFHTQTVRHEFYTFLKDFSKKLRPDLWNLQRNHGFIEDGYRFARGEKALTKEGEDFGKVLRAIFEYGHSRYVESGGNLGKITNYTPQVHERLPIKNAGIETWKVDFKKEFLVPDDSISGVKVSPEEFDKMLDEMWDAVVNQDHFGSQGNVRYSERPTGKGTKLSERRAHSRVFHFKDADSFFRYNAKYGTGERGLAKLLFRYMDGMSKDIGIMNKMGGNPNSAARAIADKMLEEGSSPTKRAWTNAQYKVMLGVHGDDSALWWRIFTGSAGYLRFVQLGSATISALTDGAFSIGAAKLNGLGGMGGAQNYLKGFINTGSAKQLSKEMGYYAEVISGSTLSDSRFAGEFGGEGLMKWLNGFGQKVSGLQRITEGARTGAALNTYGTLGRELKKPFGALHEDLRRALSGYGIDEFDWDVLRGHGAITNNYGVDLLMTPDMRVTGKESGGFPAVQKRVEARIEAEGFIQKETPIPEKGKALDKEVYGSMVVEGKKLKLQHISKVKLRNKQFGKFKFVPHLDKSKVEINIDILNEAGKKIGSAQFHRRYATKMFDSSTPFLQAESWLNHEGHRGLGIMTEVYKFAEEMTESKIISRGLQTESGRAFYKNKGFGKEFGVSKQLDTKLNKLSDEGLEKFVAQNRQGTNPRFAKTVEIESLKEFRAIADKVDDFVNDMRSLAVNDPTLASRVLQGGSLERGSFAKALVSGATMYKGFPMTVFMRHLMPSMRRVAEKGVKGLDVFALTGTTSLALAYFVVLPFKDIIKGQTPQKRSGEYFAKALLQSGTLGLLGDIAFKDTTQYGSNWGNVLLGPMGDTAEDIWKANPGQLWKMSHGTKTTWVADNFRLLKKLFPFRTLWYGKLLIERALLDNLHRLADSKYDQKLKKFEKKMDKRGQEFWWRPGGDPKIEKVLGE